MRLLLVEDDQNLSDAIAEQLQKEGYITDCCYDGETALHYALNPEYGYDIVLLDRMLPIIDGLTVLKAMRQKQIFTPVLILTGLGELEDKIEGLDCGADDYLVKPFHIRELLARIRALTRRPVEIQERKTITAYGLVLDAEYRRLVINRNHIIMPFFVIISHIIKNNTKNSKMITNNQWGLNYQANDTPLQFSDTPENPRAAAGLHSPQAHYKPATPARCSRTYSVQPPLLPECSQRRSCCRLQT